ncbi:hypothetical protein ACRYCC_31345 [Actinomadura scrupuli]|uniref:hypothetical protein n=1 Tax=Actinomadura scrupuli TaxID=559629 RepID=UPI003D96E7C9
MKHVRSIALVSAGAAVTLALVSPSASAATTTVHAGDAAGVAYAGNVRATLTSPLVSTTALGSATCDTGTVDATVQSDGSALDVSVWDFHNGSTTTCPSSVGGEANVGAVGLPWNGGSIAYAPAAGGRDGTFTVNNFKGNGGATGWFGTINCTYRGTGPGNSITLDFYNPDNPNRPETALAQAQLKANNVRLTKDSGSFLCPGTVTYNGNFQVVGETTAGSGSYDQTLYLTS